MLRLTQVATASLAFFLGLSYSFASSLHVTPSVSVSAVLTSIVALSALVVLPVFLVRRPVPSLAPLLWLVLFSGVYLAAQPNLPGLQHLLSLVAFVGLVTSFALLEERFESLVARVVILYVVANSLTSLSALVWFLSTGNFFPDARSFALASLIGLSLAAAFATEKDIFYLPSWIIFFSIAASGSRTATVIAALILALSAARSRNQGLLKKIGRLLFFACVSATTYWLLLVYRPALRQIWKQGDEAISLPLTPGRSENPIVVVNSNGRIDAWASLLSQMGSAGDYLVGKGTGFSAIYLRSKTEFFDQSLNEYLRYFVDNGIVGVALFGAWIVWTLISILKGPRSKVADAGLFALSGLVLASLTEATVLYGFFSIPLAIILGLGQNRNFRKIH